MRNDERERAARCFVIRISSLVRHSGIRHSSFPRSGPPLPALSPEYRAEGAEGNPPLPQLSATARTCDRPDSAPDCPAGGLYCCCPEDAVSRSSPMNPFRRPAVPAIALTALLA